MKSGRAQIGFFQNMRIKNLRGVSEVRLKKTRLLHLGNVEKPPHPPFLAQPVNFDKNSYLFLSENFVPQQFNGQQTDGTVSPLNKLVN